jgi:hypothetical protein
MTVQRVVDDEKTDPPCSGERGDVPVGSRRGEGALRVVVYHDIGEKASIQGKCHALLVTAGDHFGPFDPPLPVRPPEEQDLVPLRSPDLVANENGGLPAEVFIDQG